MSKVNTSPARIVNVDEVLAAFGISKPTLYRGIKAGLLPAPIKISARRVGWRSADIDRIVVGNSCGVQS